MIAPRTTFDSTGSVNLLADDCLISRACSETGSTDWDEGAGDAGLVSAKAVAREIECVHEQSLSDDLKRWIGAYARVGKRDEFLWKWCRLGVEVTTLPGTAAELREHVCDTKVLGVMLDVLLDDVADEQRDPAYLEFLLQRLDGVPATSPASLTDEQRRYAEVTAGVWEAINSRVQGYPRYAEFADLLRFDYRQLFNTMRYSQLLNGDPALLNLTEHDLYLPHNMHMMVSATMDLMCSPAFDHAELGIVREAVWRAQYMGRVGNLVTTWEREVSQRDYTSGVFASLLSSGDLSPRDLAAGDRALIDRTIRDGRHEQRFLQRWRRCRDEILMLQPRVRSVDLGGLVGGLERLICLHLGSRGAK